MEEISKHMDKKEQVGYQDQHISFSPPNVIEWTNNAILQIVVIELM